MFVNVRMFLDTYASMIVVVVSIIVNVCMFVNYHFMNMVMLMFFAH